MSVLRIAVVGVGAFGANHARILAALPGVRLSGIFDQNRNRAEAIASQYGAPVLNTLDQVAREADCAVVATPTTTHEQLTSRLLLAGLHVLVEKPIAPDSAAGLRMLQLARQVGRVLQVGHLERFNPAIQALQRSLTIPLFFEIHRLSVFTPRSLDVDVVLDLMIHDLDIVLTCTGELPSEVHAAGISVLSPLVDIANVRLQFPSGCVANLTASRVSTEKVRKLRLFQPGEYISVDYQRQEALRLAVVVSKQPAAGTIPPIAGALLPCTPGEPLQRELEAFIHAVRTGSEPAVTAAQATSALQVAESILVKIKEHAQTVTRTVQLRQGPGRHLA